MRTIGEVLRKNLESGEIESIKQNLNLGQSNRATIKAVMLQCKTFLKGKNLCMENKIIFTEIIHNLFLYATQLAENRHYVQKETIRDYNKLWKIQVESNQNHPSRRKEGIFFIENFLTKCTSFSIKNERELYFFDEAAQVNRIMKWMKQEEEKSIIELETIAIDVLRDFAQEKL